MVNQAFQGEKRALSIFLCHLHNHHNKQRRRRRRRRPIPCCHLYNHPVILP